MSRSNAKQEKINKAKKSAPKVPGDTCPSIDYCQAIAKQIADRGDEWGVKQGAIIENVLEYIRSSNQELRDSSFYWYQEYKRVV
ncbi:MAG: hypothetical protein CMO16_07385 [Thaumarchaeota archaeon]|nr:hypothetical protein [Nitrososphaerota archaeon]